MIHYHGVAGKTVSVTLAIVSGGHAFVSFRYPDHLGLVLEACQSFAVDNGAFSAWRSGQSVTDWSAYYAWVEKLHCYPSFDFAVIPDVIDGDEHDNDRLLAEWPWKGSTKHGWLGAPVWHMHESIDRLQRLAHEWPRVCLGSSGQYATVGTALWWGRITKAMHAICNAHGNPICKLHGMRMLNPAVFSRLPLASADSTNIVRNVGIDSKWRGTYTPPTHECRALVMRHRIESHQAPTFWEAYPVSLLTQKPFLIKSRD